MTGSGVAQAALFSCFLIMASVWDIRKREIPDTLNTLLFCTGLLSFAPDKLAGPLLGLPLLIAALGKKDGMGGGDIKLTAAAGFVLGLPVGTAGLILGLSVAILYHLAIYTIRKLNNMKLPAASQTSLPLAPFLSAGFITAYFMNYGGLFL